MSVKYSVYQSNLESTQGLFYARVMSDETIDLASLAAHMSSHNSIFDEGTIRGLLIQMAACIKELLLDGKNVKLDDLVLLSLSIRHNAGAASESAFTAAKHIKGLHLCSRATGAMSNDNLTADATFKKVTTATSTSTSSTTTSSDATDTDDEVTEDDEQGIE